MQHGFVKIAAATPHIKVADPFFNAREIKNLVNQCVKRGAKLIAFPELCLTGATCNDLFLQRLLIEESKKALEWLAKETAGADALIFVGLPWKKNHKLYNVSAALNRGKVIALIPQSEIANYGDRDGMRYFTPAERETEWVSAFGYEIPFTNKVLLQAETMEEWLVGCVIGEASLLAFSKLSQAGAVMLVNLYAAGEAAGAEEMRKTMVQALSKATMSGVVLSGAGEGESTQDLVFFGHKIIGENGKILKEGHDNGEEDKILIQDVDIFRLQHDRMCKNTYQNHAEGYVKVTFHVTREKCVLDRKFSTLPFVPQNPEERKKRLSQVLTMQAKGLKKRLAHTGCRQAVIGISGGLDSTLALLVTVKAFDMLELPRSQILCVTMPCFGTTDRTYDNACRMAEELGTTLEKVDIKEAVELHFRDIKQDKNLHNVTYENSQARERTQVLMDIANRENAMVIGTGDMSELALGWATYNGDHMSMYGVNAGVPKTLVRYLVDYCAATCEDEALGKILRDVLETPVSPELLPPKAGTISQKTEDLVGPYELHDFFLYYMLRFGYEPEKIYRIATESFEGQYKKAEILKWLKVFCRRFFSQQFKRSCLPDGPKIGSVCLSPRGDLRMPSDASGDIWLKQLENMEG